MGWPENGRLQSRRPTPERPGGLVAVRGAGDRGAGALLRALPVPGWGCFVPALVQRQVARLHTPNFQLRFGRWVIFAPVGFKRILALLDINMLFYPPKLSFAFRKVGHFCPGGL